MYHHYFDPILRYQKNLLQNCDTIQDSKYILMETNTYFRGKGYLSLKWSKSFENLIFSKRIILLNIEDAKINVKSFNFRFSNKIFAVIGPNSKSDLQNFYHNPNSFTHLIFLQYFENHKTNYNEFINRKFYIQTAISNKDYYVNSRRIEYLKACMDFFGNDKVANYGVVFKNQYLRNNGYHKKLPPNAYFGFAMENSIADYRITEKLFLTYRNDVIPIYRGSVKNKEILKSYGVNAKAFIDASNMSIPELVQYLKELIEDKKKMYEIYSEPLIPDKQFFDQQIKNNFKNILYCLDKV